MRRATGVLSRPGPSRVPPPRPCARRLRSPLTTDPRRAAPAHLGDAAARFLRLRSPSPITADWSARTRRTLASRPTPPAASARLRGSAAALTSPSAPPAPAPRHSPPPPSSPSRALACAPTTPPRRRGRIVGRGRRGDPVPPARPAVIPTGRRRRRPVRLIRRGPGRAARCRRYPLSGPADVAPPSAAAPDIARPAACPAGAARPTYPGSQPRLALGRRRQLLVGGPRHVPGSHRPRQRDPHTCHASSVSRFRRASPTCPTSRTRRPARLAALATRLGQKIRGHQGAGSQLIAVESRPTAPGRSSRTRPAAASAASRVPPR